MSTDTKVKVAIRVRPFNRREIELGTQSVVEVNDQQIALNINGSSSSSKDRRPAKQFAFDNCFWSFDERDAHYASQELVYKELGVSVLESSFQGYNGCIFAYGQTGSGKSYTMMGSPDNKGLIPRLCDGLFEQIAARRDDNTNFKVEVSYMEIYNEKVHDLLDPHGVKRHLRVREHNILGPYVDGLSTLAVSSYEEIDNLMTEGNKSRTVAATNMNSESSRSHAVFTITLTCSVYDTDAGMTGEKVSKMSLVDLAGSERAVKTGAVGDRLKEGSNINKSLTTLGLVISKLADAASGKIKSEQFVPYRDSVLTWLLKDNLGGNSKTVMVATVSPAADNYDETLSTLRYADRAKRIVNHAIINEDPNARMIRELKEEVEILREQLKTATAQQPTALRERLDESEKLIMEMTQTWEEKLRKTELVHQERQSALEKMGISVQSSGIKVQTDKYYLVNLNADPSLNELLVYYLKERTLVGRSDAPVEQDIQLSGIGIQPEHCVIEIDAAAGELSIVPFEGARNCVNGSVIVERTALKHGDRLLWGNNHFFKVSCPKTSKSSNLQTQHGAQQQPAANRLSSMPSATLQAEATLTNIAADSTSERPIDFQFAREELMMKALSNDPIQGAMHSLEKQHEDDKMRALEKQRDMYEKQLQSALQMLRNQMSPSTPYAPYSFGNVFDPNGSRTALNTLGLTSPSVQSRMDKWAKDRDELFKTSLAKLKEDIVKANSLVLEANCLAQELGRHTEFKVTLQIPAANLSPNRKRGAFVSEPAILVKRKSKGSQVWNMEKLENKLIDMRELYEEWKEKGSAKSSPQGSPSTRDEPPVLDPFYESQETHHLIGVANIFLEVLFNDVMLDYQVPIISQQGEVAGRLQIEIGRVAGQLGERMADAGDSEEGDATERPPPDEYTQRNQVRVRVSIKAARGLPICLSNFVFCQYSFWGYSDAIVVPPVVNNDFPISRRPAEKDSMTFKFDHTNEFTVTLSEEFLEHCTEGALSIEVWGHRSAGFSNARPGWEVAHDAQVQMSRSLADRWAELKRKIELWVEIHELNENGEYTPVEVTPRPDNQTAGVYQLRQGQQRRISVRVNPVQDSGTLPVICEAVTSLAIGGVQVRSKLQRSLDSYQEEDLCTLRDKWSEALNRRKDYLDDQIQKIINKPDKTEEDKEREQSLIDQWVSLTEERNAVKCPVAGTEIPGAPADWDPPPGMEEHVPVIFLDLNTDDMSIASVRENEVLVAGLNSILPKEHGSQFFNLPIVKCCEKDVSAVAVWDSSMHDSPALNRATGPNERVHLILKASVRLSHPAVMDLILRKRLSINVYKKQSLTERLKKRITRTDFLTASGVTYEVVSSIPKASEDIEDRETLALVAASELSNASFDGESYIEKYTKGVSAVESILALDRLRQEVAVKELLTLKGESGESLMRKTASVPNFNLLGASFSGSTSRLDHRADMTGSAFDLASYLGNTAYEGFDKIRQRASNLLSHSGSSSNLMYTTGSDRLTTVGTGSYPASQSVPATTPHEPPRNSFGQGLAARPNFLNLNYNLNLALRQANAGKISPLTSTAISPHSTKFVKPMSTVIEEQARNKESLDNEEDERDDNRDDEEDAQSDDCIEFLSHNSPPRISETLVNDNAKQQNDTSDRRRRQLSSEVKASSTEDSLSEPQSEKTNNPSTPSIMSSGYGSQPLSGTPVSEDSVSLHSSGAEETTTASGADVSVIELGQLSPIKKTTSNGPMIAKQTVETSPRPLLEVNGNSNVNGDLGARDNHSPQRSTPDYPPEVIVDECFTEADLNCSSKSLMETSTHSTFSQDDNESLSSYGSRADFVSVGNDSSNSGIALNHSLPEWIVVGESVRISPDSKTGVVAFIGTTHFSHGVWIGVELDAPTGKNNGTVDGVTYFTCKPRYGIFVKPEKLKLDARGRSLRATKSSASSSSGLQTQKAR